MTVQIISFRPEYAPEFRDLNIEWLESYFHVEPHDAALLDACEEVIIKQGGYIFFALVEGVIVGTYAFMKISKGIYELGKMAVKPNYRGMKVGQKLMEHAILFAKKEQWQKIILYSNTILENAIYIYRKYGFEEVKLEKNEPYKRSNIKMELNITQ
ncbi:GNAT family N-acetyltransferase [Leptobacterium sp. I13]|uniref:GNAT family N-acetyltransferase n=1 Tax=Leptobacterium meishanense TaxID=3128904 RepID=UPI0030ED4217